MRYGRGLMASSKKGTKKGAEEGTQLPPKGDPETVYLIDISGYIFRAYHALPPLNSSRGEPTHAVRGVTSMILKLIDQRDPKMLGVALDAGSFRKDIYPKYKANRPEPPPDLARQIERIMEVLDAWGIPKLSHEGFEADDVIATAAKKCRAQGLKLVIVSADKDLLQLVGGPVTMLDTQREKIFGVPETVDKFGVPPEKVRDLLALTGDASDNVPGVPSIGPKSAATLLKEYGDFDTLYEKVDGIKRKGWRTKLKENREQAELSKELVTLRYDVDVDVDPKELTYTGGDPRELRRIFSELEFSRLLAQLDPAPMVEGRVEHVLDLEALERIAGEIRRTGRMAMYTVLSHDDPLHAEIVGLALGWVEGVSAYVPFRHRYVGAPEQLGIDEALEVLRPLLSNSLLPKGAPDLKREALAWGRRGAILRGGRMDVGLASYLYDAGRHRHALVDVVRAELGADLSELSTLTKPRKGKKRTPEELEVDETSQIAGQHADFTIRLWDVLTPRMKTGDFEWLFYELEMPLSQVLAEMERVGVRIDPTLLEAMSVDAEKEMARLEKKAHELAGHEFHVGSPRALETVLFDELGLRVVKRTKTARSTDASVLSELSSEHPLPDVIVEHRTVSKLKSTYLDALPAAMDPETKRIHTRYNQTVAQTGRLSSSNPNLQNIPIRTELGRKIRDAFVPAEGLLLMAADYSQIELRILAHLSQDPELLDAYGKGEDVHVRTATALFDVPAEEVTREQRGEAKTVNFATVYGQTQWALAQNLKITRDEAQRYIDAFFARYVGVKRFMSEAVEEARSTGYVKTMLGRRRPVADIRSKNPSLRHAAERIAQNTPIQGTAADVMKVAMVNVHRLLEPHRTRMILTVHDELVFEVAPEEKEALVPRIQETMEAALEIDVPLVVDVGFGEHWGAAH